MDKSIKEVRQNLKNGKPAWAILLYARNGDSTWLSLKGTKIEEGPITEDQVLWCEDIFDAAFFYTEKEGIEIAKLITTPGLLFYKTIKFSVNEIHCILEAN